MAISALRHIAVPLRTLDAADVDVTDLEPLRDLVGNARVVSVGESAHGVREFYQLKDRLFRFLVSELGFTAFVMESGFPESLAVNEWVLGGGGDLDHLSRTGITYGFGDCAEMRARLQWMRDWNATHDRKVRFYGMDIPGSGANPRAAIAACLSRLVRGDDDAALLALSDLGNRYEGKKRYRALPLADRERLAAGIAELVDRARAAGDETAHRCAISTRTLLEFLGDEDQFAGGRSRRDTLMADNVRWILECEPRIVVSAHNGHVQRAPLYGLLMLGQLLAAALGNEMVVIGTTYGSGDIVHYQADETRGQIIDAFLKPLQIPDHTIDALMADVGLPLHLIDLRRVTGDQIGAATAMMVNHDPLDVSAKPAFDALIHIRNVSVVPGLLERTRAAIAKAEMIA